MPTKITESITLCGVPFVRTRQVTKTGVTCKGTRPYVEFNQGQIDSLLGDERGDLLRDVSTILDIPVAHIRYDVLNSTLDTEAKTLSLIISCTEPSGFMRGSEWDIIEMGGAIVGYDLSADRPKRQSLELFDGVHPWDTIIDASENFLAKMIKVPAVHPDRADWTAMAMSDMIEK